MKGRLLVSPHNDDAVLFACFTMLAERPMVLTVFDSYLQVDRGYKQCDAETRRQEDSDAIQGVLGMPLLAFGRVPDNEPMALTRAKVRSALAQWDPDEVWLPAIEHGGHEQHNLVGELGMEVFGRSALHFYLTYTRSGKSTAGVRVDPPGGAAVGKKLRALACYKTQIEIAELGCLPHFLRDQNEYMQR